MLRARRDQEQMRDSSGNLGHGDTVGRSTPTAVASTAQMTVKQVAAGTKCTLVMDAGGAVLITGILCDVDFRDEHSMSSIVLTRVRFEELPLRLPFLVLQRTVRLGGSGNLRTSALSDAHANQILLCS